MNVGGGLPPIAVHQSANLSLTHRHRGQAPSHIFWCAPSQFYCHSNARSTIVATVPVHF